MLRYGVRRALNQVWLHQTYPRPHQKFQVPVKAIAHRYVPLSRDPLQFGARQTGCVLSGPWDRATTNVFTSLKARACWAHFQGGLSWEETGIYDYFAKARNAGQIIDNCHTHADVVLRYAQLDRLFDHACQTRALPEVVAQLNGAGYPCAFNA